MRIRCSGKEVKRIRKGTSGNEERVEKEAVKERWAEYFGSLFNVEEDREAEIVVVRMEME